MDFVFLFRNGTGGTGSGKSPVLLHLATEKGECCDFSNVAIYRAVSLLAPPEPVKKIEFVFHLKMQTPLGDERCWKLNTLE